MTIKPLMIDLFCGLGGWAEGGLAEGFAVIGFDIERHEYWMPEPPDNSVGGSKGTKPVKKRGWTQGCAVSLGIEGVNAKPRTHLVKYPAELVLQDVLTLHGSQFKDAALIVASPPCQEYSYMAMPWSKAKAIEAEYKSGKRDVKQLTALFDACFRIQREASEAANRHIPMVVENVRGAQKWVGRAKWHYGSYYLWGDVPALMPITCKVQKFNPDGTARPPGSWFAIADSKDRGAHGQKVPSFRFDGSGRSFQTASVEATGIKQHGSGREWFAGDGKISKMTSSKSPARKAASAMIAKIPFELSRWIAACWKPSVLTDPDHMLG